jgi:hypothetical protein
MGLKNEWSVFSGTKKSVAEPGARFHLHNIGAMSQSFLRGAKAPKKVIRIAIQDDEAGRPGPGNVSVPNRLDTSTFERSVIPFARRRVERHIDTLSDEVLYEIPNRSFQTAVPVEGMGDPGDHCYLHSPIFSPLTTRP